MSDLKFLIKKWASYGESQKKLAVAHPLRLSALVLKSERPGPHIILSYKNSTLRQVRQALEFFESERTAFFENFPILSDESSTAEKDILRLMARAQKNSKQDIFTLKPQDLLRKLPGPAEFKKNCFLLKKGEEIPPCFQSILQKRGWQIKPYGVEKAGDFCLRGAVLDFFCPVNGPFRIELIGDTISRIGMLEKEEKQSVSIPPMIKSDQKSFFLLDYFSAPLIWPTEKPLNPDFDPDFDKNPHFAKIDFAPSLQPLNVKHFFKNPDWPARVKEQREKGMFVFISAQNKALKEDLKKQLKLYHLYGENKAPYFEMKQRQEKNVLCLHLIENLSFKSLMWPEEGLLFLNPEKSKAPAFKELKEISKPQEENGKSLHFATLKPEDLVIHRRYGFGLFKGLRLLDFGEGKSEFLTLEFKDKDKLYVPAQDLHQVQKYFSVQGLKSQKMLDKLGGSRWAESKKRVEKKIKDMTLELMNLYSLRACLKRKSFSPKNSAEFKQFEQDFPFQETPDQKKAIQDILQDLTQKDSPADRLICGDTGFGKTEVALRASFKVIEQGFQVCFIAPTTVLSFQHLETSKKRFQNHPMNIRLMNRFTPLEQQRQILRELKQGQVDMLIGTHRLLSRDIYFKKLGLLIIDEEHLFGVKSKEKIKNRYSRVDTLSLSATPIPRSFSMSLSGIRDMSLILSPPLNRKSLKIEISLFKDQVIKEASQREIKRGGQIIFIHNRVKSLPALEDKLKKLLPSARIRTAHGKTKDLEQVAVDFLQKKFDLLLCTTIVESGMDFPNAGTMFIHQPEKFGLSELYQLKGRVGRSSRQAYCYMLTCPQKALSEEAAQRLRIIQENNHLGAGIKIAQYDLEMRGAGSLMGREQSGFLQEVGHEMYFELLRDSIFTVKKEEPPIEPELKFVKPAFIPKDFIPREKARLLFYKKLSLANSEKELLQIQQELEDFTGKLLPEETHNLIFISLIRLLAKKARIRELSYNFPFLYLSFAEKAPIDTKHILQAVEKGVCEWKNPETLKFVLKDNSLKVALKLLKHFLSGQI